MTAALEPPAAGPRQRGGRGAGSVLVLRALGLGDFLTAVPAYRALRRAFPSSELTLAAPAEFEPLAALTDAIDRLLDTRGLAPIPWPAGEPPQVAVNLHGRGPQSHRLLRRLRPGRLVAFACPEARTHGPARRTAVTHRPASGGQPRGEPVWRPDEHEVRRWCRLLGESGIRADPGDLDLARPAVPAPAPGAVVVHPGAASGSRRWPPERFAPVAEALREQGHRVVVTGSAAEWPLAAGVADSAGVDRGDVLAGRLSLEQLAAQVAEATLVVCGDTGVAHLASAYRRPSVVLFGPVSPSLWGPPPRRQHVPLWKGGQPGDPQGTEIDPALLRISASEVLDATARALSAPLSEVGRTPSQRA